MMWEYKTIKLTLEGVFRKQINPEDFDTSLNQMGREGWELVTILGSAIGFGETNEVVAIFKRTMS